MKTEASIRLPTISETDNYDTTRAELRNSSNLLDGEVTRVLLFLTITDALFKQLGLRTLMMVRTIPKFKSIASGANNFAKTYSDRCREE